MTTFIFDEEWKNNTNKLTEEELYKKSIYQASTVTVEDFKVLDPDTMVEVPNDGQTMGEVMMKGNIVMKGFYLVIILLLLLLLLCILNILFCFVLIYFSLLSFFVC
jgi:hypothetical protein